MSTAFTPIEQGRDWQDMDLFNECVLGYYERRNAAENANDSGSGPLEPGGDIQALALWTEIQNWLEENCVNFVDHNVAIEGAASVTMFTLATWRAAAGLDVDGFRRATVWVPDPTSPDWTADPDFSFGVMQAGDILGPWILDDLQKGLSALKWTVEPSVEESLSSLDPDIHNKRVSHYGAVSCEQERADAIANWDIPGSYTEFSYGNWGYNAYYDCYVRSYKTGGGNWVFGGWRTDVTWRVGVVFSRPYSCDFFGLAYAIGVPFQDIDGLGLTENKLHLLGSKGESSDNYQEQNVGGAVTTCPLALVAADLCPVGSTAYERGAGISDTWWILNWNFTNA